MRLRPDLSTRYLVRLYLRYFLVILIALVLFFVSLEFLQSLKALPPSANLQVLYLWYKALYALQVVTPISILFGAIATILHLVRSNEMVALFSVGVDKKKITRPIFLVSVLITIFYIALHATPFVYADEYAKNIKKYQTISSSTDDLFFRYQSAYAFFKRLYPLQQRAVDVRVFEREAEGLSRVVEGSEAFFEDGAWNIKGALVTKIGDERIERYLEDVRLLEGFRPKILDAIYEGKTNVSLLDAVYAISLFLKEHFDTSRLRSIVYAYTIFPFFAPLAVVIVFMFAPVSARHGNIAPFTFGMVLFSLVLWGVLYLCVKLAYNQTIMPEWAIVAPVLALAFAALWAYKRF